MLVGGGGYGRVCNSASGGGCSRVCNSASGGGGVAEFVTGQ